VFYIDSNEVQTQTPLKPLPPPFRDEMEGMIDEFNTEKFKTQFINLANSI
jgi:hypothetical protein